MAMPIPSQATEQTGLTGWWPIFRSGTHTDSAGNTDTYSAASLDEIVSNHVPAPLVIGHPQTNDPAWGWTAELRRNGDLLEARAKDVQPELEAGVQRKMWPNRSVRIARGPQGLRLVHIGFLGARAPAVEGLPAIYAAPDDESHEYSYGWMSASVLSRFLRRMREFLIAQFSTDAADAVIPEWDVQDAADDAATMEPQDQPPPALAFSRQTTGADMMPEPVQKFSQQDLDDAVAQARESARAEAATSQSDFAARLEQSEQRLAAERAARLRAEHQRFVDGQLSGPHPRLTPAQAVGLVDFMLHLDSSADVTFEFASADGKPAKVSPAKWFRDFVASLNPQGPSGLESEPESGVHGMTDRQIADAARQYQIHAATSGVTISLAQAVDAVREGRHQEARSHA